jgi:hypothetical protein
MRNIKRSVSIPFLALCGLAAAPAGAAIVDGVLVDEFIVPQEVNVTAAATSIGFSADSSPGITAIGGERELYVRKTAGGAGATTAVIASVNPGGLNLMRMIIGDANGLVQLIYDGIDAGPPPAGTAFPTINYNGLGGIDLTAGLLDPFFELELTFSDLGGPLSVWVYENGGAGSNYASTTIALQGGVPAGSSDVYTKDFDDFTLHGAATLNDIFTNAGAIIVEVNATAVAQEGWDMRIDYLKTRGTEREPVPAPATLALLGIGLGALRLRRRAGQRTGIGARIGPPRR